MIQPTIITWIIAIFGAITFLPLLGAQLIMILKPHSQKAKDLLINGAMFTVRTQYEETDYKG